MKRISSFYKEHLKTRLLLFILLLICQVAAFLGPIRAGWAILTGSYDRAFEIIKSYDRLGNAVTNGKATDFISTRAHIARAKKRRWGCVLCRILDAIEEDHCANSPLTVEQKNDIEHALYENHVTSD
jgi:hypothetical protein